MFQNSIIYLLLFVLIGCTNNIFWDSPKKVELKQIQLTSQSLTVTKGKVLKLKLPLLGDEYGEFDLYCGGKKIIYDKLKNNIIAFYAESYFSKMKEVVCEYRNIKESIKVAVITVVDGNYKREQLRVDKKRVTLSPEDIKRVIGEKKILKKMYGNNIKRPLFTRSFVLPINSKITSQYGNQRVFNIKKTTQHLGMDFRAKIGTKIKASNAGKVILARNLFFSGNVVIIDHGMGIFTLYGHLSKILVEENEYVPQLTVLGLSGMTGRVTGPHLHWGVRIHGNNIDGESLVDVSNR